MTSAQQQCQLLGGKLLKIDIYNCAYQLFGKQKKSLEKIFKMRCDSQARMYALWWVKRKQLTQGSLKTWQWCQCCLCCGVQPLAKSVSSLLREDCGIPVVFYSFQPLGSQSFASKAGRNKSWAKPLFSLASSKMTTFQHFEKAVVVEFETTNKMCKVKVKLANITRKGTFINKNEETVIYQRAK